MFQEKDHKQLAQKGISPEVAQQQIDNFKKGFPFMDIVKAATVNDGIRQFNDEDIARFTQLFDRFKNDVDMVKFVPASGAASRMFKALYEFVNSPEAQQVNQLDDLLTYEFDAVYDFFNNLHRFPFSDDLRRVISEHGQNLDNLLAENNFIAILNFFLETPGLGYGQLPKGLLAFHEYQKFVRTPFEEHLVEGARYAESNNQVKIHFTVSPEHLSGFTALLDKKRADYEKRYQVSYHISFSEQKSSTDTLAVDLNNDPFRNNDGSILFRPGGHGALIENLNDMQEEFVFIKNIDNVVPDKLKPATVTYKKVLAGVLIHYQQRIFDYMRQLQSGSGVSINLLEEISEFMMKELCIIPSNEFAPQTPADTIQYMKEKLNRPIRVCGMVKNEGEPGGGPFWATNPDNTVSLHIVESSQIDPDNAQHTEIVGHSTHFNPVDIVCGIRNYLGRKFDLKQYVNPETGFISQKSKNGRQLKAQELPGLWNGAMANWITIFVEVPIETFNPVKTVNDLLRVEHQANNR